MKPRLRKFQIRWRVPEQIKTAVVMAESEDAAMKQAKEKFELAQMGQVFTALAYDAEPIMETLP